MRWSAIRNFLPRTAATQENREAVLRIDRPQYVITAVQSAALIGLLEERGYDPAVTEEIMTLLHRPRR